MKIEKAILPLIGCLIVAAVLTGCTPHPAPGPAAMNPTASAASPTPLPSPSATATEKPTETLPPSPTPTEAVYDIFNPDSFPDQFKVVAADPMKAAPEQQTAYQTFLDKQRDIYFIKWGIKDVVDNMKNIDPNQGRLWGLVYDQAVHPEQKRLMVFGPEEIRQAVAAEDINNFEAYVEQPVIDGHHLSWPFGFGTNQPLALDPQYQKLSPFGVDVPVKKAPFSSSGFLVGVGTVDSNPDARILMMAMKKPDGQWRLVFRSASHKADFNYPAGTSCMVADKRNWIFPTTYPEAVPVGPLTYFNGYTIPEATDEFLFAQLGYNIDLFWQSLTLRNWERANGVDSIFCTYPFGIFEAQDISRYGNVPGYPAPAPAGSEQGWYRSWPWSVENAK
jgi:hypothetical protein